MNAVMVPYRSPRALQGSQRLSGLAGSTKKRNGDAFGAAFPGVNWKSDSQIILPAKFGGITVDRDGFDELAGTWYGATYHPDGDQAGWQQKFDAALKKFGAYNTFYNVQPPPVSVPTPIAITPTPGGPVQVVPTPVILPAPAPTPSPTPSPTSIAVVPTPTPTPTPAPTPTPGNITVNVPPTTGGADTSALIQQLMAQGQSQQAAFAAAMQSVMASGVQPTPQVQQAVANEVANSASPLQASTTWMALGLLGLIGVGILMSRRKERRR